MMWITYESKLKLILARKRLREERGQTNQARIKASRHGDLFYRCSVPKNLVPVEEATKARSISTLSLSLKWSLRPSEPSLNHTGYLDPARTTTLGVSCFAYKALENKDGKKRKANPSNKRTQNTLSQVSNGIELIWRLGEDLIY
jgi:hypothetical protein